MPVKRIAELADNLNFVSEDMDETAESHLLNRPLKASEKNRILYLDPDELVEYTDEDFERATGRPQPFHEYSGEEFDHLVESIRENGIMQPVIIRPYCGKNQILAGRHRSRAAKLLGIKVPCVTRNDVDDAAAARIMLDTNLDHRPQPKLSELAYAYRMQSELSKKQGYRSDLDTSSNGCTKLDTAGSIGKRDGKSRSTVHNYIRLSYLIPGLLAAVDDKAIEMMAGVELSYITEESQKQILTIFPDYGKMKKKTAAELRKAFEADRLTEAQIREYLIPKQKEKKLTQFTISVKRLAPYRDILPNQDALENLFFAFLDQLKSSMQQTP